MNPRAIAGAVLGFLLLMIVLVLGNVILDLGIWREYGYPALGEEDRAGTFLKQLGIAAIAVLFLYMFLANAED